MSSPKLRFKGFSGEWKVEQLGRYINVDSGIAIKGENITENSSGTAILRGINITEGYVRHNVDIDRYFIGVNKKMEKYLLAENDIVLGMDGSKVGKNIAIITKRDIDSILIQRVARIKSNDKSDYIYIYQQLFNPKFHRYVDTVNTSSGIPHISIKQIQEFLIPVPSTKPEQEKIATFFTTIDQKLNLLKEKKEKLERYKKGVMQQVFSQKLRFKDEQGSGFPDWEEKKLGEIANIYDGTHQTPTYVESGVPFYSVEHLTADNFSRTKFISEEHFIKEEKRVKLCKGDILMTRIGDIGTSKLIDWDVRATFYVSLSLIKLKTNDNASYVNQYIKSPIFQNESWRRTIHVAFPKKINLGEIGECLIEIPTLPEQEQIAQFLTTLDAKINLVETQIQKTELWKKGLLQQMFV